MVFHYDVVDDITAVYNPLNFLIIKSLDNCPKMTPEIAKEFDLDESNVSMVLSELKDYNIVTKKYVKTSKTSSGPLNMNHNWYLNKEKLEEIIKKARNKINKVHT